MQVGKAEGFGVSRMGQRMGKEEQEGVEWRVGVYREKTEGSGEGREGESQEGEGAG